MATASEQMCCDCRSEALQVVLNAASGSHADTRNKAVRLIANKLFAQPQLQETIAAFARQMLFKLTATAAAPDASALAVLSAEQPGGMPPPQDPSATPPPLQGDPIPTSQPPSAPQQHQQQHQYQSEEDGTRFAGLFCALCTKQQALLRDLLLVYGRAAEGSKAAIEAVAPGTDC